MNESPELLPAEENKPAAQPSDKKPKDRSPAYPAIGLRRALEHAQKLWDIEKRLPMLVPRAATNMGFTAKSSGGLLALSAMKKFGLLDDEGSGATRKVKLSDTAISLLNPSTPNKEQLLKTCAMKPPIHAEMWTKFGPDGGSEGSMRDYLLFERGFFDEAAKLLIGEYKETIAFAKLTDADKVGDSDKGLEFEKPPADEIPPPTSPAVAAVQHKTPDAPPPAAQSKTPFQPAKQATPILNPDIKYLAIPTDIGDAQIPMGMSEEDFILFGQALTLFKKKIVRPEYPRHALWANKDHDEPVIITGAMGERDGIKYYQSSTGTGIPGNELVFLPYL